MIISLYSFKICFGSLSVLFLISASPVIGLAIAWWWFVNITVVFSNKYNGKVCSLYSIPISLKAERNDCFSLFLLGSSSKAFNSSRLMHGFVNAVKKNAWFSLKIVKGLITILAFSSFNVFTWEFGWVFIKYGTCWLESMNTGLVLYFNKSVFTKTSTFWIFLFGTKDINEFSVLKLFDLLKLSNNIGLTSIFSVKYLRTTGFFRVSHIEIVLVSSPNS